MAQPRTGKMVGRISAEVVNYPAEKLIRAIGVQNFVFKWVNAHDLLAQHLQHITHCYRRVSTSLRN